MSWPQNMSNKNVGYYIKTAVYIVIFRKAASYNRYEHNNPHTGLASAPQSSSLRFKFRSVKS